MDFRKNPFDKNKEKKRALKRKKEESRRRGDMILFQHPHTQARLSTQWLRFCLGNITLPVPIPTEILLSLGTLNIAENSTRRSKSIESETATSSNSPAQTSSSKATTSTFSSSSGASSSVPSVLPASKSDACPKRKKPVGIHQRQSNSTWRQILCCCCRNATKLTVKQVKGKAEFDEIIRGDKLVVVDFYATWCGPCKIISPQLEVLAKDHPDVVFIKIDVDESEDITEEYKITAMPTFILFKKGEEVGKVVGASIDKIKEQLLKNL